jgi:hypothetical protein
MRQNPERAAWYVTLTAFAVFVLLCAALIYAIQWLLFQSTTPMTVALTVSRGTVSVIPPDTAAAIAVTDQRAPIEVETTIQTDSTSQGVLTFYAPGTDTPIASLVLHSDSSITLSQARAPRFSLNPQAYWIQIGGQVGRSEALIFGADNRPVDFEIISTQAVTRMSERGHYIVDVGKENTRITTREGLASAASTLAGRTASVPAGRRAIVTAGRRPGISVIAAERQLLTNSRFGQPYTVGWNFYNDRLPSGKINNVNIQGREAVVIDRASAHFPNTPPTHGETGLVQFADLDVSGLAYLELRATFYIEEQSLSTCGVAGSECPMMLHMVYVDAYGTQRVWRQGFYASHDPSLGYPLACDTCRSEHKRVALRSWYTFETGNLMVLLPSEQRPAQILQVSFYASGHWYKVYVDEFALLGATSSAR